ncbi:MAG: YvcK family protein [Bryobacteraceae bacterium]
MGGGTGLSTLLHGLKRYAHARDAAGGVPVVDITAVVTVTDDGGSSGRLRREFAVLPPGDIRNCLVALSEDETLLSRLFQYRFSEGRGLKGHSFGNLFLTALSDLTGDFTQAVRLSSEVLAIAGKIYPATPSNVALRAHLEDGTEVTGESRISKSRARIDRIELLPSNCRPLKETLRAIREADLITLGPGSLFTSVIPNLLVHGIPQAIARSSALTAYFVNLMWQPGETAGFGASDHVAALHKHAGIQFLDCAVLNTRPMKPALLRKYAANRARPVENDVEQLHAMGLKVVAADLLDDVRKIRHDPAAAAAVCVELARRARRQRVARERLSGKSS